MKIGPLEGKPAVTPVTTDRKGNAAPASKASGGAEPSAKVALSNAASLETEGSDPVFDAEKVKRIAGAIRDGKFTINAEAIADKLIANAAELMNNRRG